MNWGGIQQFFLRTQDGYFFMLPIDSNRFILANTTRDVKFGLMTLDLKRTSGRLREIPYQMPKLKESLGERLRQLEEEFKRGIMVFISYSTKDMDRFHIKYIAERLTAYKEIEDVLYWQEDAHGSLVEYMNANVPKCDVFLLFCSQNALRSDPIRAEWETAHVHKKFIIPVFESIEDIPPLLRRLRGIHFQANDLDTTFIQLYQEILDIYASALT